MEDINFHTLQCSSNEDCHEDVCCPRFDPKDKENSSPISSMATNASVINDNDNDNNEEEEVNDDNDSDNDDDEEEVNAVPKDLKQQLLVMMNAYFAHHPPKVKDAAINLVKTIDDNGIVIWIQALCAYGDMLIESGRRS